MPHTDGRQSKVNYNLAWAKTLHEEGRSSHNSARGVWTLTQDGEACDEEAIRVVPARFAKWTWKIVSRWSKKGLRFSPR